MIRTGKKAVISGITAVSNRRQCRAKDNKARRKKQRFPRKLLIRLVAAAGLEPATYGF